MKSATLLTAGLLSALLPTASFANCPYKLAACMGIDANGQEHLIKYFPIHFKSVKVHNVGSFFTGLWAGFECAPCVDGCKNNINDAIEKCDEEAKKAQYIAGDGTTKAKYLEGFLKEPKGVSLGKAINSILKIAEKSAKALAAIAQAKNAKSG